MGINHMIKTQILLGVALGFNAMAQDPPGDEFKAAFGQAFSPTDYRPLQRPAPGRHVDAVRRWHEITLAANALDHTPSTLVENRVFGEQYGPGRTSRAFAIVHIAMFDALNAILRKYESYTGVQAPTGAVSPEAAVSQAACDALSALYPSQQRSFQDWLAEDLQAVKSRPARQNGVLLGKQAAAAILALRSNDGSQHAEPIINVDWLPSPLPGRWRQDPIGLIPVALGAYWSGVTPFVLETAAQFRAPPPPAMTSAEYTAAYNEVKSLGGDGVVTPTMRTEEQTQIGIAWGYDGTPGLGTPPRQYNQIAMLIADQMKSNDLETARLLALVNVAMADTAIAVWEAKYFHDFWRPVTGIRESDPGTGPTGAGDGNPLTVGDPAFSPLGAPASNLSGPNFSPPFPAYPSGHAGFGGALFQVLRRFYGRDNISFARISDESNGITRGNDGMIRPLLMRGYASLSQAEEENGQSRIYLGIHWSFDKTAGIAMGRAVANHVFDRQFRPLNPSAKSKTESATTENAGN